MHTLQAGGGAQRRERLLWGGLQCRRTARRRQHRGPAPRAAPGLFHLCATVALCGTVWQCVLVTQLVPGVCSIGRDVSAARGAGARPTAGMGSWG
jgi:hypothetical protein